MGPRVSDTTHRWSAAATRVKARRSPRLLSPLSLLAPWREAESSVLLHLWRINKTFQLCPSLRSKVLLRLQLSLKRLRDVWSGQSEGKTKTDTQTRLPTLSSIHLSIGRQDVHTHARAVNQWAQWCIVPMEPIHTIHSHYSPWKQESAFAHMWRWRCTRAAAALDNKLFQGQIADKNPFFHPAKKDQERGREERIEREREKL